ncbi:uncharacterized protein LOC119659717 [Hermetia illucens]|uniref:uncharacterized protein LOC119659717 n=1 Tax=Hermetia illucens TaxID=343691 RepID=UPI0018CC3E38|nr:uncharacterized protein LOC119659717 [Hermetia illucens]
MDTLDSCVQPFTYEREFINAYEALPLLWDETHIDYTDKYKRNEALDKLLVVLKKIEPTASVKDVKDKVNTLRSDYRRELMKIAAFRRSAGGSGEVYVPKSWTFQYLHFLGRSEKPMPLDNEATSDCKQSPGKDGPKRLHEGVITSASVNKVMAPPLSKKPKKGSFAKQNELVKPASALSEDSSTRDSSRLIADEWAEALNRLEPTQRLFAIKAINEILLVGKLGKLHENFVQINASSQLGMFTRLSLQD